MSLSRILKGVTSTVDLNVEVDGTLTDLDSTPTIVGTRADGTTVSGITVSHPSTGVYRASIPAEDEVTLVTLVWSGELSSNAVEFTTYAEVVGGLLFTVGDARAFDNPDGSTGALNSSTVYPSAVILEERDRITDLLEAWTGRSWTPRYVRLELHGSGTRSIWIGDGNPVTSTGFPAAGPGWRNGPWRALSVTVGGSSVSTGNVKVDQTTGELRRTDAAWTKGTSSDPWNVTVELEYGETRNVDGVERIALLLLRDRLVKSEVPDSAVSLTGEFGNISLVQPGGPYGNVSRLPEVNHWVTAHKKGAYVG